MAVSFDETANFYAASAAAATDFADADWSVGLWTRVDDNTGSFYQYAFSTGPFAAANTVNLYLHEASQADSPNSWRVRFQNAAITLTSSSSPGGDGLDRLIVFRRTGDTYELWFCVPGQVATLQDTATLAGIGALTAPGDLNIGRRTDGNADRYFGGIIGEVFKAPFALSEPQITALGNGLAVWQLGADLDAYWPLDAARATQKSFFGTADLTSASTGTTASHFLYRPSALSVPVATTETTIRSGAIVDVSSVLSAVLPSFDDSQGTVFLDDDNGNKHAYAWSSSGFSLSSNGSITAQYPPIWNDPTITTPGTTYYVDATGGSNGNNGTSEGTAKQTLAGIPSLSAGDTVLLKRGETWTETLNTGASGTAANAIKYSAYGTGNLPIVDGENTRRPATIDNDYIWLDSIDFANGSTFIDVSGDDVTMTNCTVRDSALNGLNTADSGGARFRFKDGIVSGNQQRGLSIGQNTGTSAVSITNVIADSTFHNNGASAFSDLHGAFADHRVYGCNFYDTETSNTICYRSQGNIEGNEFIGETRMHDNTVWAKTDAGGRAHRALANKGKGGHVYRNKVFEGSTWGLNGFTHARSVGDTTNNDPVSIGWAHHNVVYDMTQGTASETGALGGGGLASEEANAEGVGWYWNNTVNDTYTAISLKDAAGSVPDNRVKLTLLNNLVSSPSTEPVNIEPTNVSDTIDYNFYYDIPAGSPFKYQGSSYNFAGWQGQGHDTNGDTIGDPLYANTAGGNDTHDYGLGSSSPARSVGTDAVPLLESTAVSTPSFGTVATVDPDPNAWIGMNYVPHATSPDAGAYQYLSGKTLDFSKWFVGLQCNLDTAKEFKLWTSRKVDGELNSLTT